MYYTYILKSLKNGKYYIGSANNVDERLIQHNNGKVKSTRFDRPWKIVHLECFSTRAGAVRRERQIKSWKNRVAIERLINNAEHRGSSIASGGPLAQR